MARLKNWIVEKYLQVEEQAVRAMNTADFYGNLLTEKQKLYIVVSVMLLMAMAGLYGAVQFIALVYIMNKMTPEDKE